MANESNSAVLETPAPAPGPSLVQELKAAKGGSLGDAGIDHSQNSSLSAPPPPAPAAPPITPKAATSDNEPPAPTQTRERGPDGKFLPKDGQAVVPDTALTPQVVVPISIADLTDDELSSFAEAEGLDLKTPEDRAFVARLFARELARFGEQQQPNLDPNAAPNDGTLTEFERALGAKLAPQSPPTPPAAAIASPAPPNSPLSPPPSAGGPVASPQPVPGLASATYAQLSEHIGDGFQWSSPLDAIQASMDEYARIAAEADMHAQAGRAYKPNFQRLQQIEEAKEMRAFARQLPAIGQVVKQLFDSAIGERLGTEFSERLQPILPAVQHFQMQQQANSVNAAIESLAAIPEYAQIRDFFAPTPNSTGTLKFTDPETHQVTEFPDNPINRVFVQHPEMFDIEVAPNPAKGISELDAFQLTAIKRYRMAMNFINAQRVPQGTARQLLAQGLKAGKAQSTRQLLEQTRQRLNGSQGAPASSRGGGAGGNGNGDGDSAVAQMISNGGLTAGKSFGSLFK